MACIHCVSVLKCLLVLVVAALLGRHLVAGLGLALGVLNWGNVWDGFYGVRGGGGGWGWEATNTGKHIFILF